MRSVIARIDSLLIPWLRRWSLPALRVSLGVVFVWFGALKVFGVTPVFDLVASTVYWVDPDWFVPALGIVEILIGVGLIGGWLLRWVLLAFVLQMAGTALVFVVRPEVAFQDGNPLKLTVEGEFVIKNLVLLAAGLVVGSTLDPRRGEARRPAIQDPVTLKTSPVETD
ncbi:MAG TPA: DoxX family protein [Acidimicrobiia bacterium]|nr:DoxX family protein [Acidimicrobiia bacterium]